MARRAASSKSALGSFAGFSDLPEVSELVTEVSGLSLDYPEMCRGIEATLRTLVICRFAPENKYPLKRAHLAPLPLNAFPRLVLVHQSTSSFRAPRTRLMYQLLQRFNPKASMLRMKSFVARHDYVFGLLLLLNVK